MSGSPKMSTSGSKSRYRSKPRHRRGSSRGSHSDFAAILKSQPAPENAPQPAHPHQAPAPYPPLQQQDPRPPPATPQGPRPRLNVHGQDIATCANNLRYFGPAAALRSPLSSHAQRRMPGSSPDLISAAMAADCWRSSEPDKGQAGPWGCCQADPYDPCVQCRPEQCGSLDVPFAEPVGRSPDPFKPPAHSPPSENAQGSEGMEENGFIGCRSASSLGIPHHITPPVLPRKTRPLQKVGGRTGGRRVPAPRGVGLSCWVDVRPQTGHISVKDALTGAYTEASCILSSFFSHCFNDGLRNIF